MPFTDRSGVTICYETHGDPDDVPLMLVCGLGMQLVRWDEELLAALTARGFFVIAHDNRDIGLSESFAHVEVDVIAAVMAAMEGAAVEAPYLLSDMAADAVAVLDDLGVERAHVVGTSMGGMIGQAMAIEHGDRVASLTSIMSTTGDPDVGQPKPEVLGALLPGGGEGRDAVIEATVETFRAIGSPEHFDEDLTRAAAARAYDRAHDPLAQSRQLVATIASGSRSDALRSISVPTLVVHGAEDPLIDVSGGRRTAEVIPGAELLVVEGMGHDIPRVFQPQIIEAVLALVGRAESAVAS
ncbi:MAG: alpha/beta fold hydrolase [Acidimicrobiales bacterium]|nr:alpha/beta fold hydrolase [Acidimicrobiales bacterium]MCB1014178.1 alpha/beta fold hydrolase [Acidimicrobiales bacterium]MCB9371998.1 alpha/beta fold hydrolase [Microthrixaceae bacterium]